MTIIIVVVLVPMILILSVRLWVEIIQIDLIMVIRNHGLLSRWQYSSQSLCHAGVQRVGEHNVELDDEPSFLEWISVLWHPLPLHLLQVACFDHLAADRNPFEKGRLIIQTLDDEPSFLEWISVLWH